MRLIGGQMIFNWLGNVQDLKSGQCQKEWDQKKVGIPPLCPLFTSYQIPPPPFSENSRISFLFAFFWDLTPSLCLYSEDEYMGKCNNKNTKWFAQFI